MNGLTLRGQRSNMKKSRVYGARDPHMTVETAFNTLKKGPSPLPFSVW